jgi:hypothetical protein
MEVTLLDSKQVTVLTNITAFLDVMPCRLVHTYHCFEEPDTYTFRVHEYEVIKVVYINERKDKG